MTARREGPRFMVRTWQETTPSGGGAWFARLEPVSPWTAPFSSKEDEKQGVSTCPDTPRETLAAAVAAAVEKWDRLWGTVGGAE